MFIHIHQIVAADTGNAKILPKNVLCHTGYACNINTCHFFKGTRETFHGILKLDTLKYEFVELILKSFYHQSYLKAFRKHKTSL